LITKHSHILLAGEWNALDFRLRTGPAAVIAGFVIVIITPPDGLFDLDQNWEIFFTLAAVAKPKILVLAILGEVNNL
jgi:hypothetical protein